MDGFTFVTSEYKLYEILNDWLIDIDLEAEGSDGGVEGVISIEDYNTLEEARDMYVSIYEHLRELDGSKFFTGIEELRNILDNL